MLCFLCLLMPIHDFEVGILLTMGAASTFDLNNEVIALYSSEMCPSVFYIHADLVAQLH